AAITPLTPGAGPPPTKIPSFLIVIYQLSVAGCRLSVVGCRLSVVGCRLSVVFNPVAFIVSNQKLTTNNHQLTTNQKPTTDNRQPTTDYANLLLNCSTDRLPARASFSTQSGSWKSVRSRRSI